MRSINSVLFILTCLCLSQSLHAQTPETILDSVNAGRKPERLFTHFDKPFYHPGETVWFKTYTTVNRYPGTFSTVAKAELLNSNGKIIYYQVLPVTMGAATGAIVLPDTLSYGIYSFRLYTQHMGATSIGNTYYKNVFIIPDASYFNPDKTVTDINIRFYPEGGNFVGEEQNTIAFACTDQLGRPANAKGTIKDSKGNVVIEFATAYNGMGKIEFKPSVQERYSAHFILPGGREKTTALPAVQSEGTNMAISNERMQKQLYVDSRFTSEKGKPAYILGEMDETVLFNINITASNGHHQQVIPMKGIPGGLLHIGVFNSSHQLLAERTCYVNSTTDMATGQLTLDRVDLSKRGLNKISFSLADSLEGNFSIAVTDMDQASLPTTPENIVGISLVTNNLLLPAAADLYEYGSFTGDGGNDALDLLLLTLPYKWNWAQLAKIAGAPFPDFNEYYINLKGTAYTARGHHLLPNADLSFVVNTKDSAINYFSATTNDKGYFEVQGMFFSDTATIFVKNNSTRDRDKKVELEILSRPITKLFPAPVKITTAAPMFAIVPVKVKAAPPVRPALEIDSSGVVLQELIVKSKKISPTQQLENRYSTGVFNSSSRATIDFINHPPTYSGGNVFDYLKGRYSYMQVMGNFPNYFLVYRGMFSLGTNTPVPMSIFLDEMQVDASMLTSVPISEIAMVRIYTSSGLTGTGGAVAIYRKKGDDRAGLNDFTFMNKLQVPGFSKVAEFYSPDYDNLKKTAVKADNRTTLYWNPSLSVIPEDGPTAVTFYNNDHCKKYRIVIQGVTTSGKFVYVEKVVQ